MATMMMDAVAEGSHCHICGTSSVGLKLVKLFTNQDVPLCSKCFQASAVHGEQYIIDRGKLIHLGANFALIAPNVFSLSSHHGPGNMKVPGLWQNNRLIVVRLNVHLPREQQSLCALNMPTVSDDGSEPFAAIERLERLTNQKVSMFITPDCLHNMSLKRYAETYPQAQIVYPGGRVNVQNKDFVELPNAKKLENDSSFQAELAAMGLDAYVWHGAAERSMDINKPRKRIAVESVIFFYRPLKLIMSGDHHQWFDIPGDKGNGALLRLILFGIPKGKYNVTCEAGTKSSPLHDLEAFKRGIGKFTGSDSFDWEFVTNFHVQPNFFGTRERFEPLIEKAFSRFTDPTKASHVTIVTL